MTVYKNIKQVNWVKKQETKSVVSKRKLHLFSTFFVCIITFGLLGFSVNNLSLSKEVKHITSSWSPNIKDLGKLKFVINQGDVTQDVFSDVSSMAMPFENTFVEECGAGQFLVNGLGGLVVKSCLDGKVSKVKDGDKKSIHISHGKGLVSVYEEIDTIGVKEGDVIKKNSPIGISNSSIINFKILFRNKIVTGLTVKDGQLSFF